MKYRVFNTIKNRYVTDEEAWILTPDGRLAVNEDGDEIGCPHCVVEFSTGLLDANGNEIFENDLIDFGGEILTIYWNGETFQWQARNKDWHYIEIGWIAAAEILCVGKMTTKVVGNIRDNSEYMGRMVYEL